MNNKQNILLVSATIDELYWLHQKFEVLKVSDTLYSFESSRFHVNHLISGVGIGLAAVRIASELNRTNYDFCLQAGIAGSFYHEIPILSCVEITSDIFAEIISPIEGLWKNLSGGCFQNHDILPLGCGVKRETLPVAKAITVNTVTCEPFLLEIRKNLFNPQVESMEGASFFAACNENAIPCFQWRCISNYTGSRESGQWNIKGACSKISGLVYNFLISDE